MMNAFKYLFLMCAAFAIAGCGKSNDKVLITKSLEAFTKIQLNSTFDVVLIEDTVHSITFYGAEKRLENIKIEIVDSTLMVDDGGRFKWLNPKNQKVELRISSKYFALLTASETCSIRNEGEITSQEFGLILENKANEADLNLNTDVFYYYNNFPCGGKVTLRGNTNLLKVWNYALMTVDAAELNAKDALVENHALSNCTVNVKNKLDYSIRSLGNIIVLGNPTEINAFDTDGEGKLELR